VKLRQKNVAIILLVLIALPITGQTQELDTTPVVLRAEDLVEPTPRPIGELKISRSTAPRNSPDREFLCNGGFELSPPGLCWEWNPGVEELLGTNGVYAYEGQNWASLGGGDNDFHWVGQWIYVPYDARNPILRVAIQVETSETSLSQDWWDQDFFEGGLLEEEWLSLWTFFFEESNDHIGRRPEYQVFYLDLRPQKFRGWMYLYFNLDSNSENPSWMDVDFLSLFEADIVLDNRQYLPCIVWGK
jgi:hypothetical protein